MVGNPRVKMISLPQFDPDAVSVHGRTTSTDGKT